MKKIIILLFVVFNISQADVCQDVKEIVGTLESNNKYNIINTHGYLGKYQLGAMSLIDIGLVKKQNYLNSTYTVNVGNKKKVVWKYGLNLNVFLSNPYNWNIKGGKYRFLNDTYLQELAMEKMCNLNAQRLIKKGINLSNPRSTRAILVAAHLGGVDNAYRYILYGDNFRDAYGTPISKYFAIGARGVL